MSRYLQTLRRVPDDIVLSAATREIVPSFGDRCLCGWFVREQVARMAGKEAESVGFSESASAIAGGSVIDRCVTAFGGSCNEWSGIYWGIAGGAFPAIEEAFVTRVLEAVEASQ